MTWAKILVVEDNDAERRMFWRTFEIAGYQVSCAASAKEARKILVSDNFDLVLSDLGLETDDAGLELLRFVRKDPARDHIAFITITGNQKLFDDLAASLKMGASDCLMKPFEPCILKAKVEKLLDEARKKPRPVKLGAPATILHVEDEDAWADIIRLWLEDRDVGLHRVASAFEMHHFLDRCERPPDCIVMDLGLGDGSGFDACDEIKSCPRLQRIPIIILTGQEGMELRGLKHEALHVLNKSRAAEAQERFVAIVDALLKQHERSAGVVDLGDLRLDPRRSAVFLRTELLCTLDSRLFAMLSLLVERSPLLVTDEELRQVSVKRSDYQRPSRAAETPKTVEVYISHLRGALGECVGKRIVREQRQGFYYRP